MVESVVRTRVKGMRRICLVLDAENNLIWEKSRVYFILLQKILNRGSSEIQIRIYLTALAVGKVLSIN